VKISTIPRKNKKVGLKKNKQTDENKAYEEPQIYLLMLILT
jgi:hypothetical protein